MNQPKAFGLKHTYAWECFILPQIKLHHSYGLARHSSVVSED